MSVIIILRGCFLRWSAASIQEFATSQIPELGFSHDLSNSGCLTVHFPSSRQPRPPHYPINPLPLTREFNPPSDSDSLAEFTPRSHPRVFCMKSQGRLLHGIHPSRNPFPHFANSPPCHPHCDAQTTPTLFFNLPTPPTSPHQPHHVRGHPSPHTLTSLSLRHPPPSSLPIEFTLNS